MFKIRIHEILQEDFIKMLLRIFREKISTKLLDTDLAVRQKIALSCFNKATSLLYAKKFRRAEKQIECYQNFIDYNYFFKRDKRTGNEPLLSIIVVAYKTQYALIDCVESLLTQINSKAEIIIVDNGGNQNVQKKLWAMSLLYIKSPQNLILSEGRNIGAYFARGEILVFIDDDAVASKNFIKSIIHAFYSGDIYALRGKVLPKTGKQNRSNISHYNLGKKPIYSMMNTEGNSAILKKIYQEFGGMNPLLFGHEGMELSFRIYKKYGTTKIIYWPETVIYHDYANTTTKFEEKNKRSAIMNMYLLKRNRGMKKYKKLMKLFILEQSSSEIDPSKTN